MWIRKSSAELTLERRSRLIRNICLIALLWAGLWYALSHFRPYLGASLRNSALDLMSVALIGVILLVWRLVWPTHEEHQNTLICDRCNIVKSYDGQLTCKCGGEYRSLLEMKWITPAPEKKSHPTKIANQPLAQHAP